MKLSTNTFLSWSIIYMHMEDLPTLACDPADQAQQLTPSPDLAE